MTDSQKLDMLLSAFQGFQTDMQSMKTDMQDMKTKIKDMKTDMQDMKTDIQDTKHRVTAIELHLENTTDRNIQLLAENHLMLVDKLNQAVKVSDTSYLYEIKVNLLTERVDKLEQDIAELKNSEMTRSRKMV